MLEMPIPGDRHEDVGNGEQKNRVHRPPFYEERIANGIWRMDRNHEGSA